MKRYILIPGTLFCLVVVILLIRKAIKDATIYPETWEDLFIHRKIDQHRRVLLEELKKKESKNNTTFADEDVNMSFMG